MNGRADKLAKWVATKNYDSMKNIPHEIKRQPSFQEELEEGEVLMIDREETWMTPVMAYLASGALPEDKKDTKRICVNKDEEDSILEELHEGACGVYDGASKLVRKALLQGYYWPTMKEQATTLVKRCWPCQQHALVPRKQASEMKPIGSG
ncbi:uncharacterized protein LOC126678376 [Mercurialis annua]|uniref:uncharacterized protein LOC126678376 n=1 Tax=Mercurialis annua TaxID=3986 RepID=UPI00215FFE0E|nr:uncharacterized protein LOC126678376 [Mercurialis annua]